MRVQFALCAQTASVDRASNRISIFNVIDHIAASNLPLILPAVTFVAIFENESGESATFKGLFDVRLNNTEIAKGEIPVSFVNRHLARTILNVGGLQIREAGALSFRLAIPNEATAEVTVQVLNLAQEAPTQSTPPTTHS